jgi:FkbM family methyltransferase
MSTGGEMTLGLDSPTNLKELGYAALKWYVRHFPISKGKGRLINQLWKPLSSGQTDRQTVLRQADVRLACDLSQTIQRHLYFWGGYEEESCYHWIKLAQGSRVVFDIGANVGLYSLLAASVNPESNVYAFEPTPEMVTCLADNIRLNGLLNIIVEPMAVGSHQGKAFLRLCSGSDGTNEGMNYVTYARQDDNDLPVPVTSLDGYCQDRSIDRIDLLKLDIEGGEYEALRGAQGLLQAQAVDCIFLELIEWAAKRSGHSTAEIQILLQDAGYHLYRVHSRELVPIPEGAIVDGENVIACARKLELYPW